MKLYAELIAVEIRREDIVLLPLSLMECHGPHLPLGTDLMIARFFALQTAGVIENKYNTQTLLLPEIPLGVGGVNLAGTIHADEETVRRVLEEWTDGLLESGLSRGVITSGHAGSRHLLLLEDIAGKYREKGFHWMPVTNRVLRAMSAATFLPSLEEALRRPLTDQEKTALLSDGHAGLWETSFMLAAYPGLVRPVYHQLPERQDDEWSGQPGLASPELGQAFITVFNQIISGLVAAEFFSAD